MVKKRNIMEIKEELLRIACNTHKMNIDDVEDIRTKALLVIADSLSNIQCVRLNFTISNNSIYYCFAFGEFRVMIITQPLINNDIDKPLVTLYKDGEILFNQTMNVNEFVNIFNVMK